jgi:hypothetical protein
MDHQQQFQKPHHDNQPFGRSTKFCNYCKKKGHLIHECRKREYNNNKNRHNPNESNCPTNTFFTNNQHNKSVNNETTNDIGPYDFPFVKVELRR